MKTGCLQTKRDAALLRGKGKALRAKRKRVTVNKKSKKA